MINKINLGATPDIVIIAGLENVELINENFNKINSISPLIKNELVLINRDEFGNSLSLSEVCKNQKIIFGVADSLLAPLGKQSNLIMNKYEDCKKIMSEENINRKIAVILVADVVGYSKHMEKDENSTLRAYSECEQILKHLLERKQGMIFNTAGDSVLVEFSSAVNAVECAVDFQDKIEQRNKSSETTTKLEFRIGINVGDVVSREGNLLGDGVNIAARLEALSQPNGVCISKGIYDLVVPKTKMTFNDLGIQKVKQNEFHAYDVLLNPSQKRKLKSSKTSFNTSLIWLGTALVLILVVGSVYLNNFTKQNDK